ncbi:MAG TPA: protein phosphatase 2C domain-containing protein [Candidatus Acidoferrales bacterium]|nr:protein phosphatase 2C domain-containing protein [Candidatus Acidoferrales bacterium]
MSVPSEPAAPAHAPFPDDALPSGRVHAEVAARTHSGSRPNNEDAYGIYRIGRFLERVSSNVSTDAAPGRYEDSGNLLVVADGLGGAGGGEVASATALRSIVDMVLRSPKWALKLDDPETRDAEIESLMTRSRGYLQRMHALIREQQASDPRLAQMGTTLTAAYTVGLDLFVLHVGDSRAYVLRRGRLHRITHGHTLAQQYADHGVLPQAAVDAHPLAHVLTRAVGAPVDTLEVDTHHGGIEHEDRLLLCSDGLTKIANDDEIAGVLHGAQGSDAACAALIDLALARGAPDNVTVVVATFSVS